MHADYYLNTLYPLQDKVLDIVSSIKNRFYLTGGTALSRAYLNHRYSDDLDFFVNNDDSYKEQVERILASIESSGLKFEEADMHESFSRIFVVKESSSLKIDFVNDVGHRVGVPEKTSFFVRTDSMRNILSNKLTALGRLEAKDVVDILFISLNLSFNWKELFAEAKQKDSWVNPIDTATILEQFPSEKLDTIIWASNKPDPEWFRQQLDKLIHNLIRGEDNSLGADS